MSSKPQALSAGLIVTKGQGAVASVLAKATAPVLKKQASKTPTAYHKALTLMLDKERYTALRKAVVDLESSGQEILIEALDAWLQKRAKQKA